MAKITIDPIVGSYASVPALNDRLQQIENALNDDVLWRDGFVSEPNQMHVDLDMNGFSILNTVTFSSDSLYLGAYPVAPTEFSPGVPLDATHEGVLYFNTTDNTMYVWTGTAWTSLSAAPTTASAVSITDAGAYYAATNVEDALQEIGAVTGAAVVGIQDGGGYFTGTDVEAALQELGIASRMQGGTSVDLTAIGIGTVIVTGIPTWARIIRVHYDNVGFNLSNFSARLEIGDAANVFVGHNYLTSSSYLVYAGSFFAQDTTEHLFWKGKTGSGEDTEGTTVIQKWDNTTYSMQTQWGGTSTTQPTSGYSNSKVTLVTGPIDRLQITGVTTFQRGKLWVTWEN